MDNNIVKATQQWAQANGLDSTRTEKVLSNMDMTDFLVFADAIEQKNYDVVGQLYNRASAHIMESYKYFNGDVLLESNVHTVMAVIDTMSYNQVYNAYQQLPERTFNVDRLSIAEMKTLVYEGFGTNKPQTTSPTQNPASQFSGYTSDSKQPAGSTAQASPVDLQQKQAQLKSAAPGTAKVQVQGQQQAAGMAGTQAAGSGVMDVKGLDINDQDPTKTQVVVSDPNDPNSVNIMSLDDVEMMESMLSRMDKVARR